MANSNYLIQKYSNIVTPIDWNGFYKEIHIIEIRLIE